MKIISGFSSSNMRGKISNDITSSRRRGNLHKPYRLGAVPAIRISRQNMKELKCFMTGPNKKEFMKLILMKMVTLIINMGQNGVLAKLAEKNKGVKIWDDMEKICSSILAVKGEPAVTSKKLSSEMSSADVDSVEKMFANLSIDSSNSDIPTIEKKLPISGFEDDDIVMIELMNVDLSVI